MALIVYKDMISRHQKILKLAYETLTTYERSKLNADLSTARGYDFIDYVLHEKGFGRGSYIGKDTYHLMRGDEKIGNAVLKGNYQRMVVVPKEFLPDFEPKHKVPRDAYSSPGALYDALEREQEDEE